MNYRFKSIGSRVFCAVLAVLLQACGGSRQPSQLLENDIRPTEKREASVAFPVMRPSRQQYESALRAMDNGEWLEAQYYLDLAIDELMSESKDSSLTAEDSAYIRNTLHAVVMALEQVYPHLAVMGTPDSTYGLVTDTATTVEDLDAYDEEVEAVDSTELVQIRRFLDTLNLSQFSLPVVLNDRVLREIHFLSQTVRPFTEGALSRKSLFEDMIRAKLRERNMPEDLLYLALVESGFKTKAFSRAKASGLWQFIAATGKRYGLHVDFWVDMRRNPEMATDAALDYLQDLYREFNDWLLAMAAYNCGEGRIRRIVRESPGPVSYWDMQLPRETMHYVPRILAATIIARHPEQYGFQIEPQEAIPYDTVTVRECVPLVNIAEAAGVSLNTIRDLNWELNRWCTPPNMRAYTLRIPAGTRERFVESYAKMDKTKFARWHMHRVRSGENLGTIARNYGLSVAELRDVNGLKGNLIRAGQNLLIPMPAGALPPRQTDVTEDSPRVTARVSAQPAGTYIVRKGDNLSSIARRFGVSIQDILRWNDLADERVVPGMVLVVRPSRAGSGVVQSGTRTHTVQAGETYYSIASNYGISVEELMAVNQASHSRLGLGQVLKLPAHARRGDEGSFAQAAVLPANGGEIWYTVRSGDHLAAIARRYEVSLQDLLKWNQLDPGAPLKVGQRLRVRMGKPASGGVYYLVQKGDTLWDIAKRHGVSIQQIMEWNALSDGKVQPGTRLKVGM